MIDHAERSAANTRKECAEFLAYTAGQRLPSGDPTPTREMVHKCNDDPARYATTRGS